MNLLFVGPEIIHRALSEMEPDWNFQMPLPTPQDLIMAIQERKQAEDTAVMILFSREFDNNREDFSRIIAAYSPYLLIAILTPDSDRATTEPLISEFVKMKQREEGLDTLAPFYFISYEAPRSDLNDAMAAYVNSQYASPDAKNEIKKFLPSHMLPADSEEFEAFTDEEEIENFGVGDEKGNGKVITVTSSKGGSGKSTVSLLLGTYLAKSGIQSAQKGLEMDPLKVCIVDLDVRDGQLGFLNGAVEPNVFTIMSEIDKNNNNMTTGSIRKGIFHSNNLDCDFIFAAKKPRHASSISPSFYSALIKKLRTMYDYIILDTSVNYLDELLAKVAYPDSDSIIFVTDMGKSSIFGMGRWVVETTTPIANGGDGIDPNKISVVVNKVLVGVDMDANRIQKAARGREIIAMLPSAPKIMTYAANSNNLDQVLFKKQINQSLRNVALSVVGDSYQLAEVPYNQE